MSLIYNDFLNRQKITSNNIEDYYRKYAQEWIDKSFADTTLVRTIKEEKYPFNQEYVDYEVHVDTVSDVTVNTNKVIGNYLALLFKECDHKTYRGQKILYENQPYLCYDVTKDLSRVAKTQIIKCNNKIRWINKSGATIEEPIFVGFEMSATNNNTTKDAVVSQGRLVCLIQGNDNTNEIVDNQRFLLSKMSAFKVTRVFKEDLDNISDEYSNMFKMYIEWDSFLNTDNTELLLADYYTSNYTLQIDQSDLSLVPSSTGQLTATTTLNGNPVTVPLTWSSSNSQVVTIDQNGSYTIVGLSGTTCTITCTITGNEQVTDNISISIASTPSVDKVLIITPNSIDSIKKNVTKSIYFGVYLNGVLQPDVVTYVASGASSAYYTITNISGGIDVKCLNASVTPLTLTFTSGTLTKVMTISLVGLL
jgi:hypothetical protein